MSTNSRAEESQPPWLAEISAMKKGKDPLQISLLFIAMAVEPGNFPPSLAIGDTVRVVVTPSNDGSGSVRNLKETTVVESVMPPAEMGTQFVVTVRAPESLATAIAASGPLHLSIVKGNN